MNKQITVERVLLVTILIVSAMIFFGKSSVNIGVARDASRFDSDVYIDKTLEVNGATTHTGIVSMNASTNYVTGSIDQGTVSAISTSSAAYTLATTDLCGPNGVKFTPLGAITTVTLPATSTMLSTACLSTVGNSYYVGFFAVGTSTVLAVPSGATLNYAASSTITANKAGILNIIRDSATTYAVQLLNFNN